MRFLFTILLVVLGLATVACSPFRIVKYKTYHDEELKGQKPAILFVSKVYGIKSLDGREVSLTPMFAGAYGGRYIYLTPGAHSIDINWGTQLVTNRPDGPVHFVVKSDGFYQFTSDFTGKFGVYEKAKPAKLPDSTWGNSLY